MLKIRFLKFLSLAQKIYANDSSHHRKKLIIETCHTRKENRCQYLPYGAEYIHHEACYWENRHNFFMNENYLQTICGAIARALFLLLSEKNQHTWWLNINWLVFIRAIWFLNNSNFYDSHISRSRPDYCWIFYAFLRF